MLGHLFRRQAGEAEAVEAKFFSFSSFATVLVHFPLGSHSSFVLFNSVAQYYYSDEQCLQKVTLSRTSPSIFLMSAKLESPMVD